MEPTGARMAEFPLSPMFAKMLLESGNFGCSKEIITIAAMMQIQNVFVVPSNQKKASVSPSFSSSPGRLGGMLIMPLLTVTSPCVHVAMGTVTPFYYCVFLIVRLVSTGSLPWLRAII